ncbi:MAG: hypothetical protein ACXVKO_11635 [Bacteriovorax sp.]
MPLFIFDIWIQCYQFFCFSILNIAKVKRSQYMVFDRGQLKYLNLIEKVNCNYCAYANGLIAFAREVASRTEQYFCPIKHSRKVLPDAHSRYCDFFKYGDAASYRQRLGKLREKLK